MLLQQLVLAVAEFRPERPVGPDRSGHRAIERKSTPWSVTPNDFFKTGEENRELFSRLVAGSPDQVAIIPAVSYGIALAARNIPVKAGQSILVLQDQFPSNVYAWRQMAADRGARIHTVLRPPDHDWTAAVLDALNENTAIAALPNCHWTDGTILDLVRIGEKCRAKGAALVIDATLQTVTGQIATGAVDLGFQVAPPEVRAPHLLGLYLPTGLPKDLPSQFIANKVYASVRGDAIRVAPHLYNTPTDLDRLFAVLEKAIK